MPGLDSPLHWLVVAVIALLVLGPKRLPGAGRALGSGIREFKDGIIGRHDEEPGEEPPAAPAISPPPAAPQAPADPPSETG